MDTATEAVHVALLGRRIVRVEADGVELRSLGLDDGTVLRFLWRVGTEPDRVGLQWERRRPARADRNGPV